MKRKILFFLCLLSIAGLYGSPAEAQFLKRIFGKEEPKSKSRPKPKPKPVANDGKKNGREKKKTAPEEIVYPASEIKARYRVDVFVPLYLSEAVKADKPVAKEKIPEKALPGLNFYEGIRLAIDSMDRFGYRMDVFVHDITDPAETPAALIAAKTMDSTDLIIGSVPANLVAPLAEFARKHTINFVSTMSPSDGNVKNNPYFTLLQPTLNAHCDMIRNLVAKKWNNVPVIVYHRPGVAVDEAAYKGIVKDSLFHMTTVNVTALPQPNYLRALLDSLETNVIIMPVLDVNYAGQLIQQLGTLFPDYRFEVYGMPSWKSMGILRKANILPNVGITVTAPFYFDASTASGQALASDYKKTFGGRPGEMVYRGYETLCWYGYLLNKYGTIFNGQIADNASASYTRFDIHPRFDKDFNLLYNENKHFYLFHYQDGSFTVAQ